jgi:cobalt-zinc-cadmium efflux system outer membrane protein
MMAAALLLTLAGSPALAQSTPASAPITLQELEQLALRNNPTTAAAAATVDAARGRLQQAGAWPNPIIGYSGEELASARDPRGAHGVFVAQTIPLGGKLRLSRDVFEKTVLQAEAARDLQQLRILGSVRQAFYSVLLAERRIQVQERLAALASEAVGVTAQLFNVGAADRPDSLESDIASRRMQLQLNQSRNDLRAERARLAAITGSPDVADRPLATTIDTAVPELERETAIQAILEQSPELRAARVELERAKAETARTQRQTFPDLFVRGGAAYNREHGEVTGRPIGWEGAVEAGISVPLFNRNAGGIAAARADETHAQAALRRFELWLRSRAEAEFADYQSAVRSAEAYRTEILPRAEEAYQLYLTRYREMAAPYPQVLTAQRTLFELSAEYLDNLSRAWQSAVRLQTSLAGDGLREPSMIAEGRSQ